MTTELQRLVDGLAWRLQRNIVVDDPFLRLQAYSSHEATESAPIDPVREQTILAKEIPSHVVEWIYSSGARAATEPFRLPLAPEYGITTQRLCVPIRQNGALLGYVWILEGSDPLSDDEIHTVLAAIESIAVVVQRDRLAAKLTRSRLGELVRELVVPDDAKSREHAATELVDADLFVASEPVVAVVVTLHSTERALRESERAVLAGWLDRICGRLSDRRHMSLVRRDHGLLLLSNKDPVISGDGVPALADELVTGLGASLEDADVYVGIGEVVDELGDSYKSYRQAQRAADVARVVGGLGRVTSFDRLGVYGLLARIPADELTLDVLPPGLLRLLDAGPKGEQLVATLETYLDCAGDARAAAEALVIHRATLYYRLQRIEEWTGAQLARGDDRLVLHLGLKIARLSGLRHGPDHT